MDILTWLDSGASRLAQSDRAEALKCVDVIVVVQQTTATKCESLPFEKRLEIAQLP